MLKAADALADAGHRVRVVSLLSTPWAAEHDLELARQRAWVWCPVDIRPACARAAYLRSGLRRRAARHLARTFGPSALPDRIAATSLARAVPELIRSATATPADLVYAGTVGGLAVGPRAARRLGTPYALDLEDLYAGDCPPTPEGELDRALILRLERAVLGGAIFLTAGSASIAEAYADRFATRPIAIHNVLPRPDEKQPARAVGSGRRRLFWFSQTVGPDRGLEDVVDALGRLALGAELHLLGAARGPYVERLRARVDEVAPRVRLSVHPPVHPELLPERARAHDIGLSLERQTPESRARCLTNKALTCITAGLAVVLTDTPGHRPLAGELGAGAVVYPPGDVHTLAERLRPWLTDDAALERARRAAHDAARRRWHWEHPLERGALLAAVERALDGVPV